MLCWPDFLDNHWKSIQMRGDAVFNAQCAGRHFLGYQAGKHDICAHFLNTKAQYIGQSGNLIIIFFPNI